MPFTEDVPVRRKVSRRAVATEERRDAILDAAGLAFADLGYHATSLRAVAARAGLSHTGLLHHFPDKAGLLEAVLDRRDRRDADAFDLDGGDGVTFLRGLVKLAERDARDRAVVELYATLAAEAASPGHPAHGYFVRRYARVRSAVGRALRDLASRDLLVDDAPAPEATAVQIVAVGDGLRVQWLLDPDGIDLVEAVRSSLARHVAFPL